ncbi:MAG: restriction endonuclease, partial [Anaerolineae bacterium]
MRIAGIYSFKNGREIIATDFAIELQEIEQVVAAVDGAKHKTKVSKEKTMPGRMLYKPGSLNKAFKREFSARGWQNYKVPCDYPTEFYT